AELARFVNGLVLGEMHDPAICVVADPVARDPAGAVECLECCGNFRHSYLTPREEHLAFDSVGVAGRRARVVGDAPQRLKHQGSVHAERPDLAITEELRFEPASAHPCRPPWPRLEPLVIPAAVPSRRPVSVPGALPRGRRPTATASLTRPRSLAAWHHSRHARPGRAARARAWSARAV